MVTNWIIIWINCYVCLAICFAVFQSWLLNHWSVTSLFLLKRLQDVEKGVLPQSKEIVIPEGVTKKDVHLAVNKLISFESIKKKNRKKNRKKNKKNKNDGKSIEESQFNIFFTWCNCSTYSSLCVTVQHIFTLFNISIYPSLCVLTNSVDCVSC